MTELLETVAQALGSGCKRLCIVCDLPKEKPLILDTLADFFGQVSETPSSFPTKTGTRSEDRDPGIWDLWGTTVRFEHWGSAMAGQGFDAIIVVNRCDVASAYQEMAIAKWENEVLRTRLLPGGWLEKVEAR